MATELAENPRLDRMIVATEPIDHWWLRLAREGRMPRLSIAAKTAPLFAPVAVTSEPAASPTPEPAPRQLAPSRRRSSIIEIALPNGRAVKVDDGIDAHVLARIVAALDGGGQ
jgi:hypothetical protein